MPTSPSSDATASACHASGSSRGLLQRYSSHDESTGESAGIYPSDSEESLSGFLESDLRKSIPPVYELTEPSRVERYPIVDVLRPWARASGTRDVGGIPHFLDRRGHAGTPGFVRARSGAACGRGEGEGPMTPGGASPSMVSSARSLRRSSLMRDAQRDAFLSESQGWRRRDSAPVPSDLRSVAAWSILLEPRGLPTLHTFRSWPTLGSCSRTCALTAGET